MREYTSEEYREVLKAIYDMGSEEREKVFGVSTLVGGYVKDFSVSALIEKYRAYNTPKTGEYWKDNEKDEMVVVRGVEKDLVRIYYCNGGYDSCYSLKYFVSHFTKTEYKSKYLELLFKEMEEVRNERDKNRVMH